MTPKVRVGVILERTSVDYAPLLDDARLVGQPFFAMQVIKQSEVSLGGEDRIRDAYLLLEFLCDLYSVISVAPRVIDRRLEQHFASASAALDRLRDGIDQARNDGTDHGRRDNDGPYRRPSFAHADASAARCARIERRQATAGRALFRWRPSRYRASSG